MHSFTILIAIFSLWSTFLVSVTVAQPLSVALLVPRAHPLVDVGINH